MHTLNHISGKLSKILQPWFFELPDELIATEPAAVADECRLLKLSPAPPVGEFHNKREPSPAKELPAPGKTGEPLEKTTSSVESSISHHIFNELPSLLLPGDLLVVNDTGVEARRIFLKRRPKGRGNKQEGARIEAVFLNPVDESDRSRAAIALKEEHTGLQLWHALIKKRKRLEDGEILESEVDPEVTFVVHKKPDGRTWLQETQALTPELFSRIGQMPIPPYLKREERPEDRAQYQNPFAARPGSAAAPTAALHFTPGLREALKKRGVDIATVTLHVGYGTFAPLSEENFKTKKLHPEFYDIPEETARRLRDKNYNRLIAVGTTTLRALESAHRQSNGAWEGSSLTGETDLFLYPPEKIKSVDGLITNFHLPGSSLLMLAACLTGKDELLSAYREAIAQKYRFYSYGDAMLVL